jgi:hypothetical protein
MTAKKNSLVPLAWAGWETRIPPDWRPMHIEGDWDRGTMVVGDSEAAVLKLDWCRVRRRRFVPETWLTARVKACAAPASTEPPRPADFPVAAYLPEVPSRGGGSRGIWFGYCEKAGINLEIAVNLAAPGAQQETVWTGLVPALCAGAPDEPVRWAVFDTGFISPPRFTLESRHLFSGDICLRLKRGRGARLTLRQVYPAGTAVHRRKIERWLFKFPFKEHRRPPGREKDAQPWSFEAHSGTRWSGMRRHGWKRLAFPLQNISARYSVAVGVTDTELDRLLLVEFDGPRDETEVTVRRALLDMNWPMRAAA